MTKLLVEVAQDAGNAIEVVDRRFSATSRDVGRITLRKIVAIPSLLRRARRAFRNSEVVVFFLTNRTGSFLVDCLVYLLARLHHKPVIHYIHTMGFLELSERNVLLRKLIKWILETSQHIVCLSDTHAEDLRRVASEIDISIIPNATLPLMRTPHSPVNEREIGSDRFIFFANLLAEKGVRDFIGVAERALQTGLKASFQIWGSAADPETFREVKRASADLANLQYMGVVTKPEEKAMALEGATALLYPSRYRFEAQPLAIIEAMSVGTPAIGYITGSIPELLAEGAGLTVKDLGELYENVERLLREPQLLNRLREGAAERFNSRHSPAEYQKSWIALLTMVVHHARR